MLRGMRSTSVLGRRSSTRFSVKTQGTGVKADIHPRGTGLILGTQVTGFLGSGVLRPSSGLQFIWTNQTSASLHFFPTECQSIVHSVAAKWLSESSILLPSTPSLLGVYIYINISHCIFVYMYDHMICFYKAEYIFPLATS